MVKFLNIDIDDMAISIVKNMETHQQVKRCYKNICNLRLTSSLLPAVTEPPKFRMPLRITAEFGVYLCLGIM